LVEKVDMRKSKKNKNLKEKARLSL